MRRLAGRPLAVLPLLLGPCVALRMSQPSALDPWTYHPEDDTMPGEATIFQLTENSCWRHTLSEMGRTPEFVKWHFAPPQSSEWLQFDVPALCGALSRGAAKPGRPRLLFVGDSMSHHQWLSLMIAMRPYEQFDFKPDAQRNPRVDPDDFAPTRFNASGTKNEGAFVCNGSLWIQHQGSQNLGIDYHGHFAFREHVEWLRSFDVVVLMLPWSVDPTVLENLDFWISTLLPRQKLIVRTATIGHEHTGALYNHSWHDDDALSFFAQRPHRAPLRSPEEVVRYFGSVEGHKSWLNKRARTERVLRTLRQRGVAALDIFYLTTMMWDRHRDPLHFCIPGPIDRWNDVLFNYLVRGHLRDYEEWEGNFSKAVDDMRGLRNVKGVLF